MESRGSGLFTDDVTTQECIVLSARDEQPSGNFQKHITGRSYPKSELLGINLEISTKTCTGCCKLLLR